jgi:thymidine phosphorylase
MAPASASIARWKLAYTTLSEALCHNTPLTLPTTRGYTMKFRNALFVMATVLLLTACGSSPEKQKAKAEAEQTKEETKTMQEYKSCLKKAKTDAEKLDACERLLKANE